MAVIDREVLESQLIISCHINNLIKPDKVKGANNVKKLLDWYNKIESNVRTLKAVGVHQEKVGPLSLQISRKLEKENWSIDNLLVFNIDIIAKES